MYLVYKEYGSDGSSYKLFLESMEIENQCNRKGIVWATREENYIEICSYICLQTWYKSEGATEK